MDANLCHRLEAAGYRLSSAIITDNVTICRATRRDGRALEVVASSLADGLTRLIERLEPRAGFAN